MTICSVFSRAFSNLRAVLRARSSKHFFVRAYSLTCAASLTQTLTLQAPQAPLVVEGLNFPSGMHAPNQPNSGSLLQPMSSGPKGGYLGAETDNRDFAWQQQLHQQQQLLQQQQQQRQMLQMGQQMGQMDNLGLVMGMSGRGVGSGMPQLGGLGGLGHQEQLDLLQMGSNAYQQNMAFVYAQQQLQLQMMQMRAAQPPEQQLQNMLYRKSSSHTLCHMHLACSCTSLCMRCVFLTTRRRKYCA
jgi:hypothetical protein